MGFGTFAVKERAARGRNPQTGATIQIAAAQLRALRPENSKMHDKASRASAKPRKRPGHAFSCLGGDYLGWERGKACADHAGARPGVFGWLIIGSIIAVLAVFSFGALNFFVVSEPAVATVGDARITQSEYAAGLIANASGNNFGDSSISLVEQLGIPERVLSPSCRELLAQLRRPGWRLQAETTVIAACRSFRRSGPMKTGSASPSRASG